MSGVVIVILFRFYHCLLSLQTSTCSVIKYKFNQSKSIDKVNDGQLKSMRLETKMRQNCWKNGNKH